MNAQDMLDLAFGQLDGAARSQAEAELSADPTLSERFDRLGRAINQLLDDGQAIEAPPDLARRTLAYVAENRRRRRTLLDYVPVKVPFRWADVAVAAGILVAGLLTLAPAVHRSRDRMNQAACVFNLQRLGLGLAQYGHQNRSYPYTHPDCPQATAGTFAALLHDSGLLDDLKVLDCPSNGACRHPHTALPDLKALCTLKATDPARYRALICWDYAYHAGYRDRDGEAHPLATPCSSSTPLLADQPPHETAPKRILPGNSPNHRGVGQNVLFSDLHVDWHNTRRLGPQDADMFLNDSRQPGPGLGPQDAVLLPSLFPFEQ